MIIYTNKKMHKNKEYTLYYDNGDRIKVKCLFSIGRLSLVKVLKVITFKNYFNLTMEGES